MKKLLPLFLVVALFISCEPSTKIVKSWHDPNTSVDIKSINKILVIGLIKDPSARRIVEDKLVSVMKVKGVQSYNYLTEDMTKDDDNGKLNQKLKSDGFNGVLIMRLLDVDKETTYVPGSSTGPMYGSYYGYYRYAAPMYYNPGYYKTDKNFIVETTVYTTIPDKLVWSGTTKTVNPENFDKAIEDIAVAVGEKMKKDGFLTDK